MGKVYSKEHCKNEEMLYIQISKKPKGNLCLLPIKTLPNLRKFKSSWNSLFKIHVKG